MTQPAPSFAPAAPKALPTIKAIFDDLGDRFNLRSRPSQLQLAQQVRASLMEGGVTVAEAPTGTGKTLGYLAGALDAQAHAANPVPIVVATATVGLQEQILRHDIPRLAAVGAVDQRKVAVAKGRGRYFCPRTAALLEDKKSQDAQFDMFTADKHVAEGGTQIALDMLKAWRKGDWDGDRDNWTGVIPGCWESSCGASSDTCVNRACEHFDKCPYMLSRAKLGQAQVIVANHDMVLADLAQRAEEQTTTALPPKKYWLVVDEGHNLPEKAVSTKRATANLTETDWLRGVNEFGDRCLSTPRIERSLNKQGVAQSAFSMTSATLVAEMGTLAKELQATRKFDIGGVSSWGLASPEQELKEKVFHLAGYARMLLDALKVCSKAYSEYAEESVGSDKAFAIRMLAQTHKLVRQTKDLYDGLESFCTSDQVVRWVQTRDTRVTLETQPLEGSDVLKELLWKLEFPVAIVSATLQIGGSFQRFKDKCGLPSHATTKALPPVFDYTRGYLHMPRMDSDPNGPGFEVELADKLRRLYENNVSPGMLVLFTSRQRMRRVVRMVSEELASRMLVQDHRPIPELVAQHKERIDRGERSILVGLDSMSEGLDLPGRYCGHVVITQLPFGVPGDPVEEARRLHLGKAWFDQAYLADMLIMLIQSTGRLIRREDDYGVITLMDKRMTTKRYAAQAMKALPGFTKGLTLKGYFDMLKERELDAVQAPAKAPAPKLTLVHSNPAPASVVHTSAASEMAATKKREDEQPLAVLWRLAEVPSVLARPLPCSVEGLAGALHRHLPFTSGPFPEEEAEYLNEDGVAPCLPAGTPASTWGERQMPQAVMLGLRFMNMSWDDKKPAWFQVLSLRPDLVQFAEILRSHTFEWDDTRREHITADECRIQLEQGLAGLGLPSEMELLDAVGKLEAEAVFVLGSSHKLPSRELLATLPAAALPLGMRLRKGR